MLAIGYDPSQIALLQQTGSNVAAELTQTLGMNAPNLQNPLDTLDTNSHALPQSEKFLLRVTTEVRGWNHGGKGGEAVQCGVESG